MTNNNYNASHKLDIINICIGENIRKKRINAGISAEKMAKILKISIRLYHKYEKGTSEIPHNILWNIATVLAQDINHFFETLPEGRELRLFAKEEAQQLLWCFSHISNQTSCDNLSKLIKEMAVMP